MFFLVCTAKSGGSQTLLHVVLHAVIIPFGGVVQHSPDVVVFPDVLWAHFPLSFLDAGTALFGHSIHIFIAFSAFMGFGPLYSDRNIVILLPDGIG